MLCHMQHGPEYILVHGQFLLTPLITLPILTLKLKGLAFFFFFEPVKQIFLIINDEVKFQLKNTGI